MQMIDRLTALNTIVDHYTVTVARDTLLGGHLSGYAQQSTQNLLVRQEERESGQLD